MKINFAEFCSNPECNYSASYSITEGPEKFCTECGKAMIIKCQTCGELFKGTTKKCCTGCGSKIKE